MAKNTIEKGITIVFRGDTTKFDDSVKAINSELKGVRDELSILNRELKLDPTNIEKLTQKAEALRKKESLLVEEIQAYQDAMKKLDPASEAFKQSEIKARELQIQLQNTRKELEKIGSDDIKLKFNALGGKFDEMGKRVTSLGKKFSGLSASAGAVAGGVAKLTYEFAKTADDINTLAKQTGLSTETLQAFKQMADLIDVDLNSMAKSAIYLTKNLDQKSALEAYEKLGVSVRDTNGSYKDSETLLFETISALQKVEDETERSILANDLLGKSYSNLGSILNDASINIYDINKQVSENGLILSQDQLDALNEVNDNIDRFKQILGGIGADIASDFAEPLADLTSKLNELANKIKEFTSRLSSEDKQKILSVVLIVATIAPALILIGSTLSALGTIMTTIGTIVSVATTIWTAFNVALAANPIGAVVALIMALVAVVVLVWNKCDKLREGVSQLWEQFKQTEAIQTLIGWFDWLIEKVKSVIDWFKSLFDWISNVVGKVAEFFSSGFEKIGNWVGGLFSSGGFGNLAYASGGYGTLELNTTINVNNNGQNLTKFQAQQFGREIVEYVNDKLGRRI